MPYMIVEYATIIYCKIINSSSSSVPQWVSAVGDNRCCADENCSGAGKEGILLSGNASK